MKAMRYHSFGGPELLRLDEVDMPQAGAGQVLVKLAATSINVADWKLGLGYFKDFVKLPLPITPGLDFSGTVAEVGPGVSGYGIGDAVFGAAPFEQAGCYAEFVVMPVEMLAPAPKTIPLIQAASAPLAALTAWGALFGTGQAKIEAGQTVLIHGAAGGVGSYALQLAHLAGGHVIVTGSARAQQQLIRQGARQVIDYRTDRFEDLVRDVDLVVDLVGGGLDERSIGIVRPGGRFVSVADFIKPETVERGQRAGIAMSFLHGFRDQKTLIHIAGLIDAGQLEVVVNDTVPLTRAAEALGRARAGAAGGKIVVAIAEGA